MPVVFKTAPDRMPITWWGTLWFEFHKQKRGQKIEEVFHTDNIWKTLPLGGLTTRLLRLNCQDKQQIKDFLAEFGNPPILWHDDAQPVPAHQAYSVLALEQRALYMCIDRLLAQKPGSKLREGNIFPMNPPYPAFYNLEPSARVHFWHSGQIYSQARLRLPKISLRFGIILGPKQNRKAGRIEKIKWETANTEADMAKVASKIRNLQDFKAMEAFEAQWRGEKVDGNKIYPDPKLEELNKKWRELYEMWHKQQDERLRLETKDYVPGFSYVTQDILALPWLEVLTAAEKDIFARECEECRTFYLHGKKKNSRFCYLCEPPSRKPIREMDPAKQRETRSAWKKAQEKARSV